MANEKLTPIDINKKEFTRRGRRGYDRYEVDSFLDQVTEDYSNVLDENADLNNSLAAVNEKLSEYKLKADEYDQKKSDLNQSIISAQEAAKKIKADAQKEAVKILNNAKSQVNVDEKYQKKQQDVLSDDYKRLKQEVAEFRSHVQALLQKQINDLTDDEWQRVLDKYYDTKRFYPDDGSKLIPVARANDNFAEKQVDNSPANDVNSYHSRKDSDSSKKQESGKRTVNFGKVKPKKKHMGTTIVFPDDSKK